MQHVLGAGPALTHSHPDLGADSDECAFASGIVGNHVRVHPCSRRVRVGGQRWNLAVGSTDGGPDAGTSEDLDDSTVGSRCPRRCPDPGSNL
jgi:hypothetical protein